MPRLSAVAPAARASESDSVAGTRPAARTTTIVVLGLACLGLACMTGVQQGLRPDASTESAAGATAQLTLTSRPVTSLADNAEVQGILTSLQALQQKHVGYVADSRFSDGQHEEATGGRQTMWEVVGRVQVADALEAAPKPLALAGVDRSARRLLLISRARCCLSVLSWTRGRPRSDEICAPRCFEPRRFDLCYGCSQIQTCQTTAVWLWVLFAGGWVAWPWSPTSWQQQHHTQCHA